MQILTRIKQHQESIVKLLPLFAFVIPLALIYWLNPADPYLKVNVQSSFQLMWKGRTFQLFFIWLIALEFILSWENFRLKISKQNKAKLAVVAIALWLPTIYVISEYYLGLNTAIANWALQSKIAFYDSMPLAIEYIVFAVLFCIIALLHFGKKGLAKLALPGSFVGLVGVLYTIDNVFPYGTFTPFQMLVPTTAMLASKTLNLMGYATVLTMENGMPTLQASGALGTAQFSIAWPCAGIESLLIFTAVTLLFLQQMNISWKAKTGFFALGAAITYFINVLRIDTIFMIGMQYGVNSNQVQMFHFYYGPLYSITWIVLYPIIIMIGTGLLRKRKIQTVDSMESPKKPQQPQPDPA